MLLTEKLNLQKKEIMKERSVLIRLACFFIIVMIALAGCETVKKADQWLTDVDDWQREIAW